MAMTRRGVVFAVACLTGLGCAQTLTLMKDDSAEVLSRQTITAPNPADPGSFAVKTLFYGAGTDIQRPEYGKTVDITTKTVDVTPFATVSGTQAKVRKEFWGFDLKKAPINGRVWYPDGPGPFPLVLVVHGNHNYRDFSDPGYGYLGELLASRGFITVSVDENFINGLSAENDGRAWLLLKHLQAWKTFNDTVGGPMAGRVDMSRIAVMGHSRGGEAAATAAAFNRLKYYPDDFKQEFDFNFDIKAVVAIAPVDGQYKPTSQFTPLENVNYLIIHGSHDGDVSTAVGLRQYERLQFTDGQPWFKSAIFMYRANHGQWNSVWGNKDNGPRSGRSLDLRALIEPEAQQQMAKVVIAGFLEATLHQKREYVPMFRDHRTAGAWLPDTMYTTKFQENGFRSLASFDRDVDLTTGSVPGVVLSGEHLSAWKETAVPFRGRGSDTQNHNAATIGWNNRLPVTPEAREAAAIEAARARVEARAAGRPVPPAEEPKGELAPPASYSISVPSSVRSEWGLGERSAVYVSLAATSTKPGPRTPPKDPDKNDAAETNKPAPKAPPRPKAPNKAKEEPDVTPIDLTVELVDTAGHVAKLPISQFGIARKPLDARIYLRAGRDAARFSTIYELIPQTFVMPMADFVAASPDFDSRQLATIRLLFDKTEAGTIVLEHVGLSTPTDPAFLSAPISAGARPMAQAPQQPASDIQRPSRVEVITPLRKASFNDGGTCPEKRQGGNPRMVSGYLVFDGATDGNRQIDPQVAVGGGHVMSATNTGLIIYTKQGEFVQGVSQACFNGGIDPKMFFDPHNKVFGFDLWYHLDEPKIKPINLSISETSDPRGAWNTYPIPSPNEVDGGGVGFSRKWIGYTFPGGDENTLVVRTAEAKAGSPATIYHFKGSLGQPVFSQDPVDDLYFFRIVRGEFVINRITEDQDGTPIIMPATRTAHHLTNVVSPPQSPQKGTDQKTASGDRNPKNVVLQGGFLWFSHTINEGGRAAVQWHQIRLDGTIVQTGLIKGDATNYIQTSIAVNKNHDVLIGFQETHADMFISPRMAYRLADDPAGTVREIIRLGEGQGATAGTSWGDYSGSVIDGDNLEDLWTIQSITSLQGKGIAVIAKLPRRERP